MTLSEQMADDIETVFTNTDDFAVSVTYRIGSNTVTFNAVPDSSTFEVIDENGIATTFETRDYLFAPSLLVINAAIRLPEVGHQIIEGGRTYKVTSPGNRRCYEYDDEYRLMMRVHTVLSKDA